MTTSMRFTKLFEPGRIGQMELRNRIVMSPMISKYGSPEGFVTERVKNYIEARARGGVGLIIVGASYVHPSGHFRINQLGISDDKFIPALSELARVIHKHGARAAIQLHHAGRLAQSGLSGMQPVAPSPIPMGSYLYGGKVSIGDGKFILSSEVPKELTVEEIAELVISFVKAAERAKKAGFDAVELHGASGYLYAQFLSSASNKRQDAYGGELKNRARFLVETIKAIKETMGADYPVWCRINGMEHGVKDGITLEEAQDTARMAQEAGADAIHVTATGPQSSVTSGALPIVPGLNVGLAGEIKKVVTVPVIAAGWITPEHGERIVQEGTASFIAMGRALIADPELPNKVVSGRLDEVTPCIYCFRCTDDPKTMREPGIRCSVNPALGREEEYKVTPAEKPKNVLIIGGGPAGMEAARVATLRGHKVSLYEKEAKLGGQLIQAAIPPQKSRVEPLTKYLETQMRKLGVKVELEKEVDSALVQDIKPDVVILATGAAPFTPDIPGIDKDHVVQAGDVLEGRAEVGDRVVVIGGELVGSETAEFLAEKGKEVTVTTLLPELALAVHAALREQFLDRLVHKGVTSLTGVKYEEITPKSLVLITKEGERKTIQADTIVLAAGSTLNKKLFDELKGKVPEIHLAGDCVEPRNIMEAIDDGSRIARQI